MTAEMFSVVYTSPTGYNAALAELRGVVSAAGWVGAEYCSITVGKCFVVMAVRVVLPLRETQPVVEAKQ